MAWEQFDDGSYTRLRKRLLRRADAQREFLEALRSNDAFSQWMQREVDIEAGDRLPVLDERLTEAEFEKPPADTERQMFERWDKPGERPAGPGGRVVPADACRSTFWGCVTLRHVQAGVIDASYLAADGARPGSDSRGLNRIERVLAAGGDDSIDAAVRTALRRLSGLPERGVRSVYVNCPFARGWWRCHLAREVHAAIRCAGGGVVLRDVLGVMRQSQEYWEGLVNLVVSRNSVLGDSKVRTALVWALAEATVGRGRKELGTAKVLQEIGRRIGIRAAWQELGVLPLGRLKELIVREILPPGAAVSDPA